MSVHQGHQERKAIEYSSYHSFHITVKRRALNTGPGSPERSISTSVEQCFLEEIFASVAKKLLKCRKFQQCLPQRKKKPQKTKNKTTLVSTQAKVLIPPNNTPEELYWASMFLYQIQRIIIQSR